ncbi:acyl-CoA dehydrogenase family protein [Streptomyces sp. B1I3]|uniref:acyl-CoA dehydrogenase family protein n=1 Tax=Streptomyces sp. B1I3 TaxID=3042264 RepID=UPI00277D6D30|nr:acyl-CoA dehydrogenase family protein [Streptomyces sp. B1I3]MDQ0794854.1 alkylation response protein AidB-like acyl-CoA dehydrogenase [Streptomyces sp. B1I3]
MLLSPTPPVPDLEDVASGLSPADRALELADRVARPTTAERDAGRRWDEGLFTQLTRAPRGPGLTGPLIPTELGGDGLSASETFALLEGCAEGSRDPGLTLAVVAHAVLATVPLRAFGTPEQRDRYLPRMASGEWPGALSLNQTQGAAQPPTLRARPGGPGRADWVLTGGLDLVAGGPRAHHFLVVATHEDGSRTAFVVDRDTPGLLLREERPTAMRTCAWSRLVLDDCQVPADAVLGTPGGAAAEVEPLLAALDWVFSGAPWLGIMRALTRDAIRAARERDVFGSPLTHSQTSRFALADLATRSELAEGLLRRAAAGFDSGGRPSLPDAAAARLFVTAAARDAAGTAARLAGPLAAGGDRLIERAHRDVLFFSRTGGGPEVLQPVVAAHLLGLGQG